MSGHNHTPEVQEHADSWHHHSLAEGMPQHEHASMLNIRIITLWGVATSVGLILFMLAIAMYFTRYTTALRHEREERTAWQGLSRNARETREAAEAVLSTGGKRETFSWVQESEGKVQIPIERAMQRVVETYKGRE